MDRMRALGAIATVLVAGVVLGSVSQLAVSVIDRPAIAVGGLLVLAVVLGLSVAGAGTAGRVATPYW